MKKNILIAIVLLTALYACIFSLRISYPGLDHGDEYSDSNVLDSGRNFVRLGFRTLHFLPLHEPQAPATAELYTHYPPLPNILNGIFQKCIPYDPVVVARFISLCVSFATILAWFFFIVRFTGSVQLAFVASVFYLTNPLAIYSQDAFFLSYQEFFRAAALLCFVMTVWSEGIRRRAWYILTWLSVFLCSLVSYEYVVYLSLFFIAFGSLFKNEGRRLGGSALFFLLCASVAGFMLHLVQNAWHFGSISAALLDLRGIAVERMSHSRDASMVLTWPNWWQLVITRNIGLSMFFGPVFLFVAAGVSAFLYSHVTQDARSMLRKLYTLCALFLVCGISWYALFPSHSLSHAFVMFLVCHLTPFAAIYFTSLFATARYFSAGTGLRNARAGIVLALFVFVVGMGGILQSSLPVGKEKIAQAKDFSGFTSVLTRIKNESDPQAVIGVNYFRYPFIRYYTQRTCRVVFDRASLKELPQLPEYFIYLPHNSPFGRELLVFLNEQYTEAFKSTSTRFPAIIFKRKS